MRFSLIGQAQVSCLAVAKRFDEVSYFIDKTLACLDRAPRVMWADNQIWNIITQKRLTVVGRLLGQHIDSRARNLSGAQRFHQSGFVYDPATCSIDKNRARFHSFQFAVADEIVCIVV